MSRVIDPTNREWPQRLNELGPLDPPEKLFLTGREIDPEVRSIAIVGTRRATMAGLDAAAQLARGLAQAGFVIVSGLAIGIDTAAHRAALEAGGHTIAVLGCGMDVPYPKRNIRLKEQISKMGTLVSEYEPGTGPSVWSFPRRNRIIAGLAEGVIVVEGRETSGALITARIALDANRHVYAVPGSIRNAMAEGPNSLIRNSQATLVTTVEDVLRDLAPALVWAERCDPMALERRPELEDSEVAILRLLDDSPVSATRLARETDAEFGALALALARLEVRGLVVKKIGGYEISEAGSRARAAAFSP
jgi:DNA processing protein